MQEKLTKEDIAVIVKDLLHAIITMTPLEPDKYWIYFREVSLMQISLIREPSTGKVISAQVAHFFRGLTDVTAS